ncbi:hypothetical protein UY3_14727 [Chelonia mydas]|uniref:Uncharacterized protein n=1 Tax=Chelonia mydas TaxID=8469 RepID=M7BIX1_CHEMY|nr:hypothetical protein UY3_14727 [Chelonia mydas]
MRRAPAPAKHRKLSAPEHQARPRHRLSSSVRPPAQPKGRHGHSSHRRPAPPKAPNADKSGKVMVLALTPAVPAAQAPSSPDLSELSADDGLERITDQPSTPGTFEAAKDLIELWRRAPSRMGRTLWHPCLGCHRGVSRQWCAARGHRPSTALLVGPGRAPTPRTHICQWPRRRQWVSARKHWKGHAALWHHPETSTGKSSDGLCQRTPKDGPGPGNAGTGPSPRPDPGPSPGDTGTTPAPAQPGAARSPAGTDRWHRHGLRDRHCCNPAPTLAAVATHIGPRTAGTLRWAGNSNGGRQAIGPSGPPGPIRSTKGPHPGQVTWCSGPSLHTDARRCQRLQYPGLQYPPRINGSPSPVPSHGLLPRPEPEAPPTGEGEQEDEPEGVEQQQSFLDEVVAGTEVSGPLPIDHRAHQELLCRVAQDLGWQAEEMVEQEDPRVDILSSKGPSRIALPLIKTIQSNYKTIWQTPASRAPTAKGVQRKYFAPSKGYEFLFCHLSPCSLVVSAVNERERHEQQAPAPKAKETKRLDLFGRKVYSSRGLQLRIANKQAILNRPNFNSWVAVGKFKDNLPQGSQQEFTVLVDKGKAVAKISLQASLNSADTAARTIASRWT